MPACAIRCVARHVDHLLTQERGLADERLVDPLLARLAQEARAFLLVGVDEDRVGVRALQLHHVRGEVHLPGFRRDVADDLDVARGHLLDEGVAPALAEVVVHP